MKTEYLRAIKALFILIVGIPAVIWLANLITNMRLKKITLWIGIIFIILLALQVFGAHISLDFSIKYPPDRS